MYGEYVDEDLPLPPFNEVFAFSIQPVQQYQTGSGHSKKRSHSKSHRGASSSSQQPPMGINNPYYFMNDRSSMNNNSNMSQLLEKNAMATMVGKQKKLKEPNLEESTG
jgi:hypothetical protein